MAKPRVFVSSTFYDLKQIREDLGRFIENMGFEPVLHERGSVPYGPDEALEEYAYTEVDLCDILIAIIGGRFGSQSTHDSDSITQREIRRALKRGIPVYIFVERSVFNEYRTYRENKDVPGIKYSFADDPRVYEFIEEVDALPRNNPIFDFGHAQEIMAVLREQWAGVFHRLLREQVRAKEYEVVDQMSAVASTLNQLVDYLVKQQQKGDQAIKEILLSNHPAFRTVKRLLEIPYPVLFRNVSDLDALASARGFSAVDSAFAENDNVYSWEKTSKVSGNLLTFTIRRSLFNDDAQLAVLSADQWDDDWITLEEKEVQQASWQPVSENDIPF